MEQQQLKYQDLIDLGFKRFEMSCSVFRGQYGYECFMLEMKAMKGILFAWHPEKRTVLMQRMSKSDVKSVMPIYTLEELKKFVDFFKNDTGYHNDPSFKPKKVFSTTIGEAC